jgi:hypothetical protein
MDFKEFRGLKDLRVLKVRRALQDLKANRVFKALQVRRERGAHQVFIRALLGRGAWL